MSPTPTTAVFTLSDLNRQPAKVLAAVRKFGSAEIRTRNGEVFTFAAKLNPPEPPAAGEFPDFKAHWKRMREAGLVPPPPSENNRIDRIIAGEEYGE